MTTTRGWHLRPFPTTLRVARETEHRGQSPVSFVPLVHGFGANECLRRFIPVRAAGAWAAPSRLLQTPMTPGIPRAQVRAFPGAARRRLSPGACVLSVAQGAMPSRLDLGAGRVSRPRRKAHTYAHPAGHSHHERARAGGGPTLGPSLAYTTCRSVLPPALRAGDKRRTAISGLATASTVRPT